jgi:hypothetical protein
MNKESLELVAKTYMAMLKSNYPEIEFSLAPDVSDEDEKLCIAFPFEGISIVDVSYSECGRFQAMSDSELHDNAVYYGITIELAHCLIQINKYLKTLQ